MNLESLPFFEDLEKTLNALRNGILVCQEDGRSVELESELGSVRVLLETSRSLGLESIGTLLEALEGKVRQALVSGGQMSFESVRDVLDIVADAEAELLKTLRTYEDPLMDVGDFIERSFGSLQIQGSERNGSGNSLSTSTFCGEEHDEFEIDAEMLEIFAIEADDLLGNVETNLDILSAFPTNRDALWEIRRNAHTFKGASGIVGLKTSSELAHRIEDLLDQIAQRDIATDESILNLLASSTKCLRSMTAGDTSGGTMARLREIYQIFDRIVVSTETSSPLVPVKVETPICLPEPRQGIGITAASEPGEVRSPSVRPIVRVSIAKLDELVRIARDLMVSQTIVEQRMSEFERQIEELHDTTRRLQTATFKIETDFEGSMLEPNQALSVSELNEFDDENEGKFDSLELDRYTDFHENSRTLSEASNDNFAINTALEALKGSFEMIFDDQRRLIREMQENVIQIRMIKFGSLTTRLERAVRVACEEENRKAQIVVENSEVEIDTDVLDSLVEPLMHLLRNAVVHGIEPSDTRRLLGKPETGKIIVQVTNEETHIVLRVSDDGRGIAASSLKEKAVAMGLIDAKTAHALDPESILDLIFLPGLTTAERLSMNAGRGVGMSIVKESIQARQGTISLETTSQRGTTFTIRIPLSFAITEVLLIKINRETVAIPLKYIKHIADLQENKAVPDKNKSVLEFESIKYPVRYLADHLARPHGKVEIANILFVETSDMRYALIVDEVLKTEEIAIKPLGRPLQQLKGVMGAAILGTGEIVPILDIQSLLIQTPKTSEKESTPIRETVRILVVDDSPSVRHMTSKVIVNAGWDVMTAKDGRDAFEILQAATDLPDVILTDVEMPRMDGYELISSLKLSERLSNIPIVLITSRSGAKHIDKASDLGISDYLTKPYDENELISIVKRLSAKPTKMHLVARANEPDRDPRTLTVLT